MKAEDEIRALVADWSRALERKDTEAMTRDYEDGAVLFDAIPPATTKGRDNIKAAWDACLPHFPDTFRSEHRDLTIIVDGDLAIVHGLHGFAPDPASYPSGQTAMRITVCYRRSGGRWRVVHEHVSVPFDPTTNKAVFIQAA